MHGFGASARNKKANRDQMQEYRPPPPPDDVILENGEHSSPKAHRKTIEEVENEQISGVMSDIKKSEAMKIEILRQIIGSKLKDGDARKWLSVSGWNVQLAMERYYDGGMSFEGPSLSLKRSIEQFTVDRNALLSQRDILDDAVRVKVRPDNKPPEVELNTYPNKMSAMMKAGTRNSFAIRNHYGFDVDDIQQDIEELVGMKSKERALCCRTKACNITRVLISTLCLLVFGAMFVMSTYCVWEYTSSDWAWDVNRVGVNCIPTWRDDWYLRIQPAVLNVVSVLVIFGVLRIPFDACKRAVGLKQARKRIEQQDSNRQDKIDSFAKETQILREKCPFAPSSILVEFNDLQATVKNKRVLRGVSGAIGSGKVTAIMGQSGAGKTTLMNVLRGRVKKTGGKIKVNDRVVDNIGHLNKITGFVPQDDIMLSNLTVMEALLFSAHMRLPTSIENRKKNEFVARVIDILELYHVRFSRIGNARSRGLSGGEKKRVNIGLEMVANPSIIFLDEPTSGLDSTMAAEVMSALHRCARAGWAVCLIIHQPSYAVYQMIDNIILLKSGGSTIFSGPPRGAMIYFQSLGHNFPIKENPADVILQISSSRGESESLRECWQVFEKSKKGSNFMRNEFEKSAGAEQNEKVFAEDVKNPCCMCHSAGRRTMSCCGQFFYFVYRSFLQKVRRFGSFVKTTILCVILAFAVGFMFKDILAGCDDLLACDVDVLYVDLTKAFVCCVLISAIISVQSSLNDFGCERLVFYREARAGYSTVAYLLGKCVAGLPFTTLYAWLFTVIIFPLLKLDVMGIGDFFFIFLLMQWCGEGIGYFVSIIATNDRQVVGGAISLLNVILTGAFPALTGDVKYVSYLSFCRWPVEWLYIKTFQAAYEGASQNGGQSKPCRTWIDFLIRDCSNGRGSATASEITSTIDSKMKEYEYAMDESLGGNAANGVSNEINILALVCMGIIWRLLTYLVLRVVNIRAQK